MEHAYDIRSVGVLPLAVFQVVKDIPEACRQEIFNELQEVSCRLQLACRWKR